jgi:hypothetical protein
VEPAFVFQVFLDFGFWRGDVAWYVAVHPTPGSAVVPEVKTTWRHWQVGRWKREVEQ